VESVSDIRIHGRITVAQMSVASHKQCFVFFRIHECNLKIHLNEEILA